MRKRVVDRLWTHFGGGRIVRALTSGTPRILVYHRFSRQPRARYISSQQFAEQMEFLVANEITVLPLTDIVRGLTSGGSLPRNVVALTVDDGYSDFYDIAFPILQRFALPATIFVPTDFVDGRVWLWPDLIRHILGNTRASSVTWSAGRAQQTLPLGGAEQIENAWSAIAEHCLQLDSAERRPFIFALAGRLGVPIPAVPDEDHRPLSWEQLRHVSRHGIEVGAHSCSHPRLALESPQRQIREITECKARLEEMLQRPARHFCYPHGGRFDYNLQSKALVKAAGYESAAVCFEDGHPVRDVLELRRYSIGESILDFQKAVYGWRLLRSRITSTMHLTSGRAAQTALSGALLFVPAGL
jgi:peptidoglycan/xylan/chitin deacetylase (PgdA/CDA1 family)